MEIPISNRISNKQEVSLWKEIVDFNDFDFDFFLMLLMLMLMLMMMNVVRNWLLMMKLRLISVKSLFSTIVYFPVVAEFVEAYFQKQVEAEVIFEFLIILNWICVVVWE